MKANTLSFFQAIDCCSDCVTAASATRSPDEKLVGLDQLANLFEEVSAQEMALAVGGYGWAPNQRDLKFPPASAKDKQALGQALIGAAVGARTGGPWGMAIGFVGAYAASLWQSYGPGSSP